MMEATLSWYATVIRLSTTRECCRCTPASIDESERSATSWKSSLRSLSLSLVLLLISASYASYVKYLHHSSTVFGKMLISQFRVCDQLHTRDNIKMVAAFVL